MKSYYVFVVFLSTPETRDFFDQLHASNHQWPEHLRLFCQARAEARIAPIFILILFLNPFGFSSQVFVLDCLLSAIDIHSLHCWEHFVHGVCCGEGSVAHHKKPPFLQMGKKEGLLEAGVSSRGSLANFQWL